MTCAQSKREVYLAFEQGVAAEDPHLASCADCKAALEAVRRMHDAFPALGADLRPPSGWQERVLAAIERPADEPARARPRGWRLGSVNRWGRVLAPIAAAAVVVLLLMSRRGPEPPRPSDVGVASALQLDIDVARRGGERRTSASVGDVATVRASGAGGAHVALWVYRDGRQFLLACPGDRRCRRGEAGLAAELPLDRPGLYQVLFAASSSADGLPAPAATLDESFAALAGADARYKMIDLEVL